MYLLLNPLNSTMSFVMVNHRRGIDSPKYQQDLFNTRNFITFRKVGHPKSHLTSRKEIT